MLRSRGDCWTATSPFLVLLLLRVTAGYSQADNSGWHPNSRATKSFATNSDPYSLTTCLAAEGVDAVTGTDDYYYVARKVFSKLFDNWPSAIAYPNSTKQVAAAVRCAREFGVNVRPRCGGHANEGECVAAGAVTIDLSRMGSVELAPDGRTAHVEGGARAGQVVAALWNQSNGTRSVTIGQRPVVGMSGMALGGGFGASTRLAGLLCDNIIALTAVDGTGRILHANATHNADLLWAARGGGGGRFAVVTDFWFRTMDVTSGVINYHAVVPSEDAVQALADFQASHGMLSNRFTMQAGYATDAAGSVTAEFYGWCYGSRASCDAEIKGVLPTSGPLANLTATATESNVLNATIQGIGWMVPEGLSPLEALATPLAWDSDRSYYKYKTYILKEPLDNEGLELVMDYASGGTRGSRVFEFQSLGGAMLSVPGNATAAFNLRSANQVVIMRATSDELVVAEEALHAATKTILKLIELSPDNYMAYVNFFDTDIVAFSDYKEAYYGDDFFALNCVDVKYDPDDVINFSLDLYSDLTKLDPDECAKVLEVKALAAGTWSEWLQQNSPARP